MTPKAKKKMSESETMERTMHSITAKGRAAIGRRRAKVAYELGALVSSVKVYPLPGFLQRWILALLAKRGRMSAWTLYLETGVPTRRAVKSALSSLLRKGYIR